MWNLKLIKKWAHLQNRDTQRQTADLGFPRGGVGGRVESGAGISRGKLAYTGWRNNAALLYSTGSRVQCPVTNHMKQNTRVWLSHCSVRQQLNTALTQRCFRNTFEKNKAAETLTCRCLCGHTFSNHFCQYWYCRSVAKSGPTLHDPMDGSLPGSGQSQVWEEATVFEKRWWGLVFLFPELVDEER